MWIYMLYRNQKKQKERMNDCKMEHIQVYQLAGETRMLGNVLLQIIKNYIRINLCFEPDSDDGAVIGARWLKNTCHRAERLLLLVHSPCVLLLYVSSVSSMFGLSLIFQNDPYCKFISDKLQRLKNMEFFYIFVLPYLHLTPWTFV